MTKHLLWIGLLAIGLSGQQPQVRAAETGWTVYRNDRLGFGLSYPANRFQPDESTQAGDGQLFVSQDGRAKLLVGAFENADRHTPLSYQRYIAGHSYSGYEIDYAPLGRTWLVLSGERGDTMFYEKVFFSCGRRLITSFAMTYPVAERHIYDPIIERIEDTFSPGAAACS